MLRSIRTAAVGAAVALAVAACGNGSSPADGGGGGNAIVISGSSTVQPISVDVADAFNQANPGVEISVDGPGTGDGFELFCRGDIDVADASRPIRQAEEQACADAGIEYVELKVGIDGIAVLTSPQNEDLGACLSFADIYALVGPESTGFTQWSDANDLAAELQGTVAAPFPDLPLVISGPGEESGTFDTFVELAIEGIAEERDQDATTRPDYQASPNDNVIVQNITSNPTAFGWVGYAFYLENQDQVRAFEVDGGSGCVAPTDETIATGSYPLARPLFIYVNTQRAADNPALRDFVDFYLSGDGFESVGAVGYVQLTPDEWQATGQAWEEAVG